MTEGAFAVCTGTCGLAIMTAITTAATAANAAAEPNHLLRFAGF
ncbi:hypothetical protein [Geobacter hydrogenophilus]|nr:hypothetical protein [Geobacter hydrogenophilus]